MKVKFTKLAALLLAGAALFATGCTDYEVDIQKANERIDNLDKIKANIADVNAQIDALNATIATLETAANHKADIDKLNTTISTLESTLKNDYETKINNAVNDLNTALTNLTNQMNTELDKKVDKTEFNTAKKALEDAIKAANDKITALENADEAFKTQIEDLTKDINNRLTALDTRVTNLENNKADKVQVAADIAAAKAELNKKIEDTEAALAGEIEKLDTRLTKAEADIETINKVTIPEINAQIDALNVLVKALQDGKLDKTEFEAYKLATAETLQLLQEAIDQINNVTLPALKSELEGKIKKVQENLDEAVREIYEKLDDYVLKTTFEEFVKIAATKAELAELESTMNGKLEQLEKDLKKYSDDADEALKAAMTAYINTEIKKLQDQIDTINDAIEELDSRVEKLEDTVEGIVDELAFAEGDLQGYIDDADAATLEAAIAYTDEYMEWLIDQLNEILDDIYNKLTAVLQRIQSIVYVPDYDDLKITTNMAFISQEVAGEETATAGQSTKMVVAIDQPSQVTYQFLPAQYAGVIARAIENNIIAWGDDPWTREEAKDYGYAGQDGIIVWFDVRPVNTRADEEETTPAPEFKILSVDSYDETSGEITMTILPVNVASASYAANGLKPNYYVDLRASSYTVRGLYDLNEDTGYFEGVGYFYGGEADLANSYGYNVLHVGVWNYEDLKAYEARSAFAAQLRLYNIQDWDAEIDLEAWEINYTDYENELASTYNVLYPAVTEINILPDPYKPDVDENGDPKTDEDGNTVLVKAVPEYQYLPYSSLRENPVGEKASQDPKGYRIILDQAVPGIEIGGKVLTVEDATKAGYLIPAIETVFDEFTYDKGTAAEVDEENFVETNQVYAEIEMNPEKSAAVRKLAIGNVITGNYYFNSIIGKTPFFGQVEITPALGEVAVETEIVWTYELDANVDHNLFYEDEQVDGGTVYTREDYAVTINADDLAYLEENLDITLESFAGKEPKEYTITYVDEETGEEVDVTESVVIDGVAITEDGKLTINISNFEWDKVYTVVATYELEAATITVNGTITTIDRNREKVVLGPYEHTFVVNGDEFNGTYYVWASEPQHAAIFEAFDKEGVINVKGETIQNGDFEYDAEQEDFNEAELEGKLRMADPSGTAKGYIDFNRNDIVLNTLKTLTPEVLAGELFNSGVRDENDPNLWLGNVVTRNVTTFIGEEVEIQIIFNFKVPDYNFLHLSYYTFATDHENGSFVQQYDFSDNDGSVLWWTQVNPSYFTGDENAQGEQISFRHALKDYDVAYINLAELAFNVVDEDDVTIEDEDLEELGLKAYFAYTDETLGEKDLPVVDQIDPDFLLYQSLWVDNTVFYYRTNEKKFIPALGTLTLTVGEEGEGGYDFPVATRFEFPKAAVKYPEEVLDYSTYAMVRWTPFQEPVAEGYTMVLDENKIYRIPLFKGMYLKDNRPNNVHYDVIKDGEWVVGNVTEYDAEAGTYTKGGNGYIDGVAANVAYHIETSFTYDDLVLPTELRKLLTIVYSNDGGESFVTEVPEQTSDDAAEYVPYVQYDYTSEVQFRGTVNIPVVVVLENPWQESIKFVYDFVIKGVE